MKNFKIMQLQIVFFIFLLVISQKTGIPNTGEFIIQEFIFVGKKIPISTGESKVLLQGCITRAIHKCNDFKNNSKKKKKAQDSFQKLYYLIAEEYE